MDNLLVGAYDGGCQRPLQKRLVYGTPGCETNANASWFLSFRLAFVPGSSPRFLHQALGTWIVPLSRVLGPCRLPSWNSPEIFAALMSSSWQSFRAKGQGRSRGPSILKQQQTILKALGYSDCSHIVPPLTNIKLFSPEPGTPSRSVETVAVLRVP